MKYETGYNVDQGDNILFKTKDHTPFVRDQH